MNDGWYIVIFLVIFVLAFTTLVWLISEIYYSVKNAIKHMKYRKILKHRANREERCVYCKKIITIQKYRPFCGYMCKQYYKDDIKKGLKDLKAYDKNSYSRKSNNEKELAKDNQ